MAKAKRINDDIDGVERVAPADGSVHHCRACHQQITPGQRYVSYRNTWGESNTDLGAAIEYGGYLPGMDHFHAGGCPAN